jgi:hypothetical protein
MRWHQNDTRTTLYVDHGGEIVARPNHTGRSWKDAVLMAAQSTNSQTSSEIPLSMGANPIALMSDKEAAEVLRDRNTAEDSPAPLTPRI